MGPNLIRGVSMEEMSSQMEVVSSRTGSDLKYLISLRRPMYLTPAFPPKYMSIDEKVDDSLIIPE